MKIQITVPCYKGLIPAYLKKLINSLRTSDTHEFSYSAFTTAFPDVSRNEAIFSSPLQFPKLPKIDAFLLLDPDMEPEEKQIFTLIDDFSGTYDILGAVTRKNAVNEPEAYAVQIQRGPSETKLYDGIIPVHTMAFSCAMVSQRVFSGMSKPWFNAYWLQEDGRHWQVPEDESFCMKARDLGYRTFCHFGIEVKHNIIPKEELDRRMKLDE